MAVKPKEPLSREEMESKVLWNGGGAGFGLCSVGNMMAWSMDHPTKDKPDLVSIVALGLPREKYTDEELAKLVAFAEKATADYDRMFRYRRGANLIIIDKQGKEGNEFAWLRKRMSWEFGVMHSATLDKAIKQMER